MAKKIMILSLLTSLFVIPMLVAWLTYSKGLFLSKHTVNHGVLIIPSIPAVDLTLRDDAGLLWQDKKFRGTWWLLYVAGEGGCDAQCQQRLYYIRQIHQATGKNRERIQRAIVTTAHSPVASWATTNFPGMHCFYKINGKESKDAKKLALNKGYLYLVDPLGNIMMFYAPDVAPKGILKDLERALKVSQIG